MLDSFPTRAAWALCTFAYSAGPGTEPVLFEGRTDGKIVPARGPPKFGWDPVFEAEDTGLTYVSCSCAATDGDQNTIFQLRRDGVDTEKRVISQGTCGAEVAYVPTSPKGRWGSRINDIDLSPPSSFRYI